jgi:hypothetical protein
MGFKNTLKTIFCGNKQSEEPDDQAHQALQPQQVENDKIVITKVNFNIFTLALFLFPYKTRHFNLGIKLIAQTRNY